MIAAILLIRRALVDPGVPSNIISKLSKRYSISHFHEDAQDAELEITLNPPDLNTRDNLKFRCLLDVPDSPYKLYQSDKKDNTVSIKSNFPSSVYIASYFLQKGINVILNSNNTQYVISDQELSDNNFRLTDNILQNDFATTYYLYTKELDDNTCGICPINSKSRMKSAAQCAILAIILAILYFYVKACLKPKMGFWVLDENFKVIAGEEVNFGNIFFSDIYYRAVRIAQKHKIVFCRNINYNPENYDIEKNESINIFYAVPFGKYTMCFFVPKKLERSFKGKLEAKVELGDKSLKQEGDISVTTGTYSEPVITKFSIDGEIDPNSISSNVKIEGNTVSVEAPGFMVMPFITGGRTLTQMNSYFFHTLENIESAPYQYATFNNVIRGMFDAIQMRRMVVLKGDLSHVDIISQLQQEDLEPLSSEVLEPLFQAHRSENQYQCIDNFLPDCHSCIIVHSHTYTTDTMMIIGAGERKPNFVMDNFTHPLIFGLMLQVFEIADSHERFLQFSRLLDLFEANDFNSGFAMVEVVDGKAVDTRMSSGFTMDKLHQIFDSMEESDRSSFIERAKALKDSPGSFKTEISVQKGETRQHYAVTALSAWDALYEEYATIIVQEDITGYKEVEEQLKDVRTELATAIDALSLIKVKISDKDPNTFEILDPALFKQLGIKQGSLVLNDYIHRDDRQILAVYPDKRNLDTVIRFVAKDEQNKWYALRLSDGEGFAFPVDDIVRMKEEVATVEKSIEMSSFIPPPHSMWKVRMPTGEFERILSFKTPAEVVGVPEFPISELQKHVLEGAEGVANIVEMMKSDNFTSAVTEALLDTPNGPTWFRMSIQKCSHNEFNGFLLNVHQQRIVASTLARTQQLRDMVLDAARIVLWSLESNYDGPPSLAHMTTKTIRDFIKDEAFVAQCVCALEEGSGEIEGVVNIDNKWYNARGKVSHGRVLGVFCDITDLHEALEQLEIEQGRAEVASKERTAFLQNMAHEIRTPMNGIFGMLDMMATHRLTPDQRLYIDALRSNSFILMKELNATLDINRAENHDAAHFQTTDLLSILEPVIVATSARATSNGIAFSATIPPNFPLLVNGDPLMFNHVVNNLVANAVKFTREGHIAVRLYIQRGNVILEIEDSGCGIDKQKQSRLFEKSNCSGGLALVGDIVSALKSKITVDSTPGVGSTFKVEFPFESVYERAPRPFSDHKKHIIAILTKKPDEMLQSYIAFFMFTPVFVGNLNDLQKVTADGILNLIVVDRNDFPNTTATEVSTAAGKAVPVALLGAEAKDFSYTITRPILPSTLTSMLHEVRYGKARNIEVVAAPKDVSRILVVEDNKTNQFVMGKLLTKLKMEYDIADNGQIALEKLNDGSHFDLVFMDCQMPVMDGLEATKRIRAGEVAVPTIPIVALTASAVEGDEAKCRDVGMDGYLSKPVKIAQISDAIKKYIR